MISERGAALVVAAQDGDQRAQDELIAEYLPLVYNIVGRALNGHADVDDVVQESMIRVLDGLPGLREPESFRSWLVAITMNQIRRHWNAHQSAPVDGRLQDAHGVADPGADFVDLTIMRLGLAGQRRDVAEATRWLEADDRALLSLWWLEAVGVLTRAEVAAALELSPQHTAVRVQRMKAQLEAARVVVRALSATPRCQELAPMVAQWDGVPSALWRKRIARHARGCAVCSGLWSGLVPAEGLLAGLALVPVAATLAASVGSGVLRSQSVAAFGRDAAGEGLAGTGTAGGSGGTGVGGSGSASAEGAQGVVQVGNPGGRATGGRAAVRGGHKAGAGQHARGRGAETGRGQRRRERQRGKRRAAVVIAGVTTVVTAVGAFLLVPDASQDGKGDKDRTVLDAAGDSRAVVARTGGSTASGSPSATPRPSHSTTAKPSPSASASHSDRPTDQPTTSATPTHRPTSASPTAPAAPSASRPSAPRAVANPASSGAAGQVIALLNTERAANGCGPLRNNAQLQTAAQRHADDMAARGFFDHTNPDGTGPGERITAAGYRWSTYGENIARGQQSPAEVMKSWMNSPGHRANILNCSFKEVGIGIHNGSGGPWWVQNFGARF
ncbi:sigma-70 family RNA polymerase sigma factor [Streptomyces sp. NPDC003077]|uniref:sigma-70 family RNA polymerase sigma factor n=1 Tax=Streptomyces sp. NPDC003077 TaxID=3154443 RepID=UPI0033B0DC6A